VRSRTPKVDRDTIRATRGLAQVPADQLRERLGPIVEIALHHAREQAASAAVTAKEQAAAAAVAAGHARDWATPRIGAAVERGRQAAVPGVEAAVEAAAERLAPAVDATRDRIVDDLLPRLVEAAHGATAAGVAARGHAAESVSRSVEDAARAIAERTPTAKARRRRRRGRSRLLWLVTALAVAGAVAAALRRRRAGGDAWELPPTEVAASTPPPPPVVRLTPPEPVAPAVADAPVTDVPATDGPSVGEPTAVEPVVEVPVAEEAVADEAAPAPDVRTAPDAPVEVFDPIDGTAVTTDVLDDESSVPPTPETEAPGAFADDPARTAALQVGDVVAAAGRPRPTPSERRAGRRA